jgi:Meiosis protein SPO22/ZIP4 like
MQFSLSLRSSNALACRFLKRFLLQRLVPHGDEEWITKTFITLLWMSTSEPVSTLDPSEFETLFNDLSTAWRRFLCPEATHGALVVGGLMLTGENVF